MLEERGGGGGSGGGVAGDVQGMKVKMEGKHMMCIVCGGGGIWWDYWELF